MPVRSLRLNDAMIERLAAAVSAGMRWKQAAEACGVPERTLRHWRARGRAEPGTIYGRLNETLVAAEARFEWTHLERIAAAALKPAVTTIVTEKRDKDGDPVKETRTTTAPPQWTPSAWLLERTRPERYSLTNRIETGPPGSFDHLNDDELSATILRLVAGGKKKPRKDGGGVSEGDDASA